MVGNTKIIDEIEFFEVTRMSLRKFYKDLYNALDNNNAASIWQLSKIMARFSLRQI